MQPRHDARTGPIEAKTPRPLQADSLELLLAASDAGDVCAVALAEHLSRREGGGQ